MNILWIETPLRGFSSSLSVPLLAQSGPMAWLSDTFGPEFPAFLGNLLFAIAILIVGWIIATVAAWSTKSVLNRTSIDNKIATWVTGQAETEIPIEQWAATAVYWVILIFALAQAFTKLELDQGSELINGFLGQIFDYLPRIGGAALLLGAAWIVASLAKVLITRVLGRFNLDDKLAATADTSATDGQGSESPFLVNETLGDIVYWFIFLLFLPFVLDALELQNGTLGPIENMIDDFLSIIPRVFSALIIGFVGWLIARVVKGIVSNLLASVGADGLGARFGLAESGGMELSKIAGTLVYVLILIPFVISSLNALGIAAISEPAIQMLEVTMEFLPRLFSAAIIMTVFYVIGRFISDIVAMFLASLGFNNIFQWLGLSGLQAMVPTDSATATAEGTPEPYVRSTDANQAAFQPRTPAEIVGIAVLVGSLLVGAVAASEALQLPQITQIVQNVLGISMQVLSGVLVFAVGLFFANLAFQLIQSTGTAQANTLAQAARVSIIIFVGAMALRQMGVATDIVNLAFGLLFGAIAVAIAIAFGLGGRDIANEEIRSFLDSFKNRQG
ncbi:MAG: mechanosensitive ion channel [Leptolyngbyaceae bacterium]|nr:mechanosensitive ion channel [Leptolyngbyaceae bacterium]